MVEGKVVDIVKLREGYERSKKNYKELSAETGIDRRHISDILNGKRRSVMPKTAALLSEAFGIPMEEVVIEGQRGIDEYNIMRGLKSLTDEQVYWIKEYIMDLRELNGKRRFYDG